MKMKTMPGAEPVYTLGDTNGVLLLHGFSGSPYEMKKLGERYQKKGFSVSIPLLAGHGTNVKDLEKCKWGDWFEDAKNALFDLRKRCKSIVVIGLSTGATLALHLAAHYQVEALVALSPAIILKNKFTRLLPRLPNFFPYWPKGDGPDIRDPEARASAVSYNKTPLRAVRELLKLYNHVEMDLPEIYIPTLIVQSEKDNVLDFRGAQIVYDTIKSTKKQLLILKESYHVVTLDVEKEIVFRETKKFVSTHLPVFKFD